MQQACPRVVLPVAAVLVKQLRAPAEEARVAALALAAGLLSCPGEPADRHFPQLFAAFLSRADDVKVSRGLCTPWTKCCSAENRF